MKFTNMNNRIIKLFAILCFLNGCASDGNFKTLRNSTFAVSNSNNIKLTITETSILPVTLQSYEAIIKAYGISSVKDLLEIALMNEEVVQKTGSENRIHTKRQSNPFVIVPRSAEADFELNLQLTEFNYSFITPSKKEILLKGLFSIPDNRTKEDVLSINILLTDKSVERVVYRSQIYVKQDKGWEQTDPQWMIDRASNKILDKLLEK